MVSIADGNPHLATRPLLALSSAMLMQLRCSGATMVGIRRLLVCLSLLHVVVGRPAISHDAVKLSRSKLYRLRQRFTHKRVERRVPFYQIKSRGTTLSMRRPSDKQLSSWFGVRDCNHPSTAGLTNPSLSIGSVQEVSSKDWWPSCNLPLDSWRVIRKRRRVGHGEECYEKVRDAALEWDFASPHGDKGIRTVAPPQVNRGSYAMLSADECPFTPVSSGQVMQIWSGPGRRLTTFTTIGLRFFRLHNYNPVTVVYDLVDQAAPQTIYSSTAYATGKRHWLMGEERVTVAYRRDTGHVDVEIFSVSRPAPSLVGKVAWPLIGRMQQSFFNQQMDALERVAR